MTLPFKTYFSGKKILVTGARGFIGSALCGRLLSSGAHVRGLSRSTDLPSPSEKECFEWAIGDIQIKEVWENTLCGIDIVFHLAAQTSAAYAEKNPERDYDFNVLPVKHLIQCANPNLTVVFAATATQYGLPKSLPVSELHSDSALSIYDQHKQEAESLLLEASRNNQLKACSLRLCNIYGLGPAAYSPDRGVLNQMVSRARQGKTITLYQNADYLRDFLYIADCVQAFLAAARSICKTNGEAYLIGSGEGHSLAEAAAKIANEIRAKKIQNSVTFEQRLSPSPLMPIETRNFIADCSKFQNDSGWKADYSLDRGIQSMLENFSCAS